MTFDELPTDLRALADPAQEVLLDSRPALRLLAPVPLRQLGVESLVAAEPYRSKGTVGLA
jgi:hypothetical protein